MPELAYQTIGNKFLEKPVAWIGSSLEDLKQFPQEVCRVVGYALYLAQNGGKHPDAKPLKGFGGASVLEVVEDYDGDTYRAVYTVKFRDAIYVLHAFQKKSKQDIDLIRQRLNQAKEHHKKFQGEKK